MTDSNLESIFKRELAFLPFKNIHFFKKYFILWQCCLQFAIQHRNNYWYIFIFSFISRKDFAKKSNYSSHCIHTRYVTFLKFAHLIFTKILFIFFQIILYTKGISIYNFMFEIQRFTLRERNIYLEVILKFLYLYM